MNDITVKRIDAGLPVDHTQRSDRDADACISLGQQLGRLTARKRKTGRQLIGRKHEHGDVAVRARDGLIMRKFDAQIVGIRERNGVGCVRTFALCQRGGLPFVHCKGDIPARFGRNAADGAVVRCRLALGQGQKAVDGQVLQRIGREDALIPVGGIIEISAERRLYKRTAAAQRSLERADLLLIAFDLCLEAAGRQIQAAAAVHQHQQLCVAAQGGSRITRLQ